jgi:hypothetical protein
MVLCERVWSLVLHGNEGRDQVLSRRCWHEYGAHFDCCRALVKKCLWEWLSVRGARPSRPQGGGGGPS